MGHPFVFQRTSLLNYICDVCGASTAVSNDGVYDDSDCNMGICEACYAELPAHFDQSKPKGIIANISDQCQCGQTLVYANNHLEESTCDLCGKNKECPRHCPNCSKRYCLKCKLMHLYSDFTCFYDHNLVKITS